MEKEAAGMFTVRIKKKVLKQLTKLPVDIAIAFKELAADLKETGPVQPSWPNFSKLSKDTYHCHLTYHYVACWTYENATITIEVYYVGSRENAPY